jgi:hypothetical protein
MKVAIRSALASLLLVGTAAQCQPADNAAVLAQLCDPDVTALRESLKLAPEVLAQQSANEGDFNYLEWYGFYSAIPGVSNQQCVRDGKFHKWFRGTSDFLCSREHKVLYERSYAFAEKHNKHMAALRLAKGLAACDER